MQMLCVWSDGGSDLVMVVATASLFCGCVGNSIAVLLW